MEGLTQTISMQTAVALEEVEVSALSDFDEKLVQISCSINNGTTPPQEKLDQLVGELRTLLLALPDGSLESRIHLLINSKIETLKFYYEELKLSPPWMFDELSAIVNSHDATTEESIEVESELSTERPATHFIEGVK